MEEERQFEWSEEMETGIPEIDEQHEKIVKGVNDLYEATKENKSREEIVKLVENLDFYTTIHFDTEEKYMKIYDYNRYNEHKKAHEFFKNTYEEIRYHYNYVEGDPPYKYRYVYLYALHLSQLLVDWLNIHMGSYDKEFINFIKTVRKIY
ncbi:MAG: hypothetical protein ACD_20C00168G0006 [uncultured bacterium]|nr:MAG: hypothetical protein ACD_20C00168G0006 [uncultured bacterium]